jgi:hypothetical protein
VKHSDSQHASCGVASRGPSLYSVPRAGVGTTVVATIDVVHLALCRNASRHSESVSQRNVVWRPDVHRRFIQIPVSASRRKAS